MTSQLMRSLGLVAGLSAAALHGVELAHDGFEGGTLAGPLWGDATSVTVSTDRAHGGTHAAKFHFAGDPSLDADAWSELRFDLGAVHPELWIRYQLFIPLNYVHRDAVSAGDNNKFIRLWGSTYDDIEKVGASTWLNTPANGYSSLLADWNYHGDGVGPKGNAYAGFINAGDRGSWMDVVVHVKAATAAAFGSIQLWKNGVLAIDGTATIDNFTPGEAHGYRYGYLLGWANTGFTANTDFYIDDVIFGTLQADILTIATNHVPVAIAQHVEVVEDVAKSITLAGTDADGDTLGFSIATNPLHGILTGSGANRIYTPNAQAAGDDSFTYAVNDGKQTSVAATVSIHVSSAGLVEAGGSSDSASGGGSCGAGAGTAVSTIATMMLLLRLRHQRR